MSAAAAAALAVLGCLLLLGRPRPRWDTAPGGTGAPAGWRAGAEPSDRWRRYRLLLAGLAGAGTASVLGGPVGWVAGAGAGALLWRAVGRLEPAAARRAREDAAAQLPVLVDLLAAALAAGAPTDSAVSAVCEAWPGAAAARLGRARSALALGVDPVAVWDEVAGDAALAPLGRALARAAGSGAPVADAVARLADELGDSLRAGVEDRARTVGVRAAVPLGLCLLPAFVLLGIVPVAAGLVGGLLR